MPIHRAARFRALPCAKHSFAIAKEWRPYRAFITRRFAAMIWEIPACAGMTEKRE
ncbi:MAG: hypothetical protein ACR2P4_04800 [Gammaproteobacteria bacterium]